MTLRFRKRIGLLGGLLHVNLSRGGVSVSAGPNGANVNFDLSGRRKHPRATLGIPGTGLSYQADLKGTEPDDSSPSEHVPPSKSIISFKAAVIILVTMILVFFGVIAHQTSKIKMEKASSQPITRSTP